jgi:hypothetical protein
MKTIELTQGLCAMVDDEDYTELNTYNWNASKQGHTYYVIRYDISKSGKKTTTSMHRAIMKTPKGMVTDHKDGNGLNNCKSNLRVVTQRQNRQNIHTAKSSKYPGVRWHKKAKKWYTQIRIGDKRKHLGSFTTEIEVYKAYLAALKSLGEVVVTDIQPQHQ